MENKNLIDKAIAFIQENPTENLSLQSIAEHAGFSLTYFDAIFREQTGYRPVEYARIYKLTRSALALRRTEKTILEIALEFGYASPESYARAFKSFYHMTPSEYREKHVGKAVTWHDLSGKIAINQFRYSFPELQASCIDLALDFCFTHNPLKYAEDMVGMTVAESAIFTLGDPEVLEHFVYVSDYNSAEPFLMLVCEREEDALSYLRLFTRLSEPRFSLRKSMDADWILFDAEIARLGLLCHCGYDMIYPHEHVGFPAKEEMPIRILNEADWTAIKAFQQRGGCAECHVRAIQLHFNGKGNAGMKPIGLFSGKELVGLAMPTLDQIRELRKYDIGAIFTIPDQCDDEMIASIWRYAIAMCLQEQAMIGNANAVEDDSPLGVAVCERVGLIKVAKNCTYQK